MKKARRCCTSFVIWFLLIYGLLICHFFFPESQGYSRAIGQQILDSLSCEVFVGSNTRLKAFLLKDTSFSRILPATYFHWVLGFVILFVKNLIYCIFNFMFKPLSFRTSVQTLLYKLCVFGRTLTFRFLNKLKIDLSDNNYFYGIISYISHI